MSLGTLPSNDVEGKLGLWAAKGFGENLPFVEFAADSSQLDRTRLISGLWCWYCGQNN